MCHKDFQRKTTIRYALFDFVGPQIRVGVRGENRGGGEGGPPVPHRGQYLSHKQSSINTAPQDAVLAHKTEKIFRAFRDLLGGGWGTFLGFREVFSLTPCTWCDMTGRCCWPPRRCRCSTPGPASTGGCSGCTTGRPGAASSTSSSLPSSPRSSSSSPGETRNCSTISSDRCHRAVGDGALDRVMAGYDPELYEDHDLSVSEEEFVFDSLKNRELHELAESHKQYFE